MYLHIGNNCIVRKNEIIGIFDMDNTTVSKRGRNFLNMAEKNGSIINATDDLPKSYIVTSVDGKMKVYISSVSCTSLQKRTE